jgi:hypothetical protein
MAHSEDQLQSELQDSGIRRRADSAELGRCRVRSRGSEINVVEYVEELGTELQGNPLRDLRILDYA